MQLNNLTAISPIDGRYREKVQELSTYFSEFALIRYRVLVEIEYFIALCEIPLPQLGEVDSSIFPKLRELYLNFTLENAQRVKTIEEQTNHDVKAIEYLIKEQFDALGLSQYKEFVHFGLTSQDINNTAFPSMLRDALLNIYYPQIDKLLKVMRDRSKGWMPTAMLARTHGQPASPTTMGKEVAVFIERISKQLEQLKGIPHSAKFGGATGNFNAHHAAYPNVDWVGFANHFVNGVLNLNRSQVTTQIEHYDNMAALFDAMRRINTILIDFSRDIWSYISLDYFTQRIKEGEVGSSAMPHKVNPIDFENAEGNLGIANAMFEHLVAKLPISRLQRDLTDSTVIRNIGIPIAHTVLAIKSLLKGIDKLIINPMVIGADLERNWIVVSEAIQTILRREGYPNPYEALRDLTRTNRPIAQKELHEFVSRLDLPQHVKDEIMAITPFSYIGIMPK